MPTPPDQIALSAIDDAPSLTIDDAVLRRNLDALAEHAPALAEELRRSVMPAHWRPVRAIDDTPTYRIEPPGEKPHWWRNTAIPGARADVFISAFRAGQANATAPSVGAGAEVAWLLASLPPHQAVYVFEPELVHVAAALRLHDWSTDIARLRLILTPPADPQNFITDLLDRHPGLLPPGNIVRLPDAADQHIIAVKRCCEQAHQYVHETRNAAMSRLAKAPATPSEHEETPRLALFALDRSRRAQSVCVSLAAAADESGWRCAATALDQPTTVHPLAHALAIDELTPTMTVCIGHGRGVLPPNAPNAVAAMCLDARDARRFVADTAGVLLAVSPAVRKALLDAGADERRVRDFFWAASQSDLQAASAGEASDEVLLVADLPNDEPAACGVIQPTHRRLWETLQKTAAKAWETKLVEDVYGLLTAAEKACDVRLADARIRQHFLQQIEYVLAPAAVRRKLLAALTAAGLRARVVGYGWSRCDAAKELVAAAQLDAYEGPRSRAAVLPSGADPLSADLVRLAARGVSILLHAPRPDRLARALGGVLPPGRCLAAFASARELASLAQNDDGLRQRAAAAVKHLAGGHTQQQRLELLWKDWGEIEAQKNG